MAVAPRQNPSLVRTANPLTLGLERLKEQWRQRQIQAVFDDMQRLPPENDRALRELDLKANRDIDAILTDDQRKKVPVVLQAMQDLNTVRLPLNFCGELLQSPRQRAAIAAIAAEANQRRKQHSAAFDTSMRDARNLPSNPRAWNHERRRLYTSAYLKIEDVDREAHSRAMTALNSAQRQVLRRYPDFYPHIRRVPRP